MATLQEVVDQFFKTKKVIDAPVKKTTKALVQPRRVADPKRQRLLQKLLTDEEDVRRIEGLFSLQDATKTLTSDLSRGVIGERSLGEEINTIETRRARRRDADLRQRFPDIEKLDKAWQRLQAKKKSLTPAQIEKAEDFLFTRTEDIVAQIEKARGGQSIRVIQGLDTRRIFSDKQPVRDPSLR